MAAVVLWLYNDVSHVIPCPGSRASIYKYSASGMVLWKQVSGVYLWELLWLTRTSTANAMEEAGKSLQIMSARPLAEGY